MFGMFLSFLRSFYVYFQSRADLQTEIVALRLKSGVNFRHFGKNAPKKEVFSHNLCSSRVIFTKVPSAFQWFQPTNAIEYFL